MFPLNSCFHGNDERKGDGRLGGFKLIPDLGIRLDRVWARDQTSLSTA